MSVFVSRNMDKATREIIKKYTPMWTVKETFEYEQKHGEPRFDVKYAHENDEKTIWGDRKMEFPNSTLRELWNNTYDYLDDHYEMWIKDTPLLEHDPPTIMDDHVRYALSMTVEDMTEDESALKFRMVNGYLIIASDDEANINDTKEFYEEFYHLIFGFNFHGDHLNHIPEVETESEDYFEKTHDEFDKRMKEKLGDRYISGNKEKSN
jgi:hypothetical protein